jgi:RHH-type proline utilization regulon transcriptional repressor/proline dehydrogenase/delta 1-pyrroline-5-carboxylate dehydrogenase
MTENDLRDISERSKKTLNQWQLRPDRREIFEKISPMLQENLKLTIDNALARTEFFDPFPSDLKGPTGESNRLSLHGRGVFLCCGEDSLAHAVMALLTGNAVILLGLSGEAKELQNALRGFKVSEHLLQILDAELSTDIVEHLPQIAGLALSETGPKLRPLRKALARREGAILPLIQNSNDWREYVLERAICIDTTASGGNTALLAATES